MNPGDVVKMEVYTKYVDPVTNNWTAALNTLMGQIATATAGVVVDGAGYVTSTSSFPYAGLVTPTGNSGAPKACLNWLVFDRNFINTQGGSTCMTTIAKENGNNVPHEKLAPANIMITDPGYMYVYLSNENATLVEVYFDDFKVTQIHSNVVAGADYYPFGLVMSTREITQEPYRYGYQGQYSEKDGETDWNAYELRQYDARIARWLSVDPYGQFASPYVGMGNNPVTLADPNGGIACCAEPVFNPELGAYVFQDAAEIVGKRIGSISGIERIAASAVTFANNGAYFKDVNNTWNFVDPNRRKSYEYVGGAWQIYRDEGRMEALKAKGLANFSDRGQSVVFNAALIASDVELFEAGVQVSLRIGEKIAAKIALKAAAKRGVQYSDDLVTAAQNLYPNKAGLTELHHITPKYLGGTANGPLVPLNGAYHQQITNAFRRAWPYGRGPITDPVLRRQVMDQVYKQFPLPPGFTY